MTAIDEAPALQQEKAEGTRDRGTGPRPFVVEALVSAGPRKSLSEYKEDPASAELGEDCAGICTFADRLIFWLCDGASNNLILNRYLEEGQGSETSLVEGLSSRMLAQDIGEAFVLQMCQALARGEETIDIPTLVFGSVAASWQERLADYLSRYPPEQRDELIKQLPSADDGTLRMMWLTTFTGGVFHQQEQRLSIINYGASGGLVLGNSPGVIEPNQMYAALLATLDPKESLQPTIHVGRVTDVSWEQFETVTGFAVMSDGLVRRDLASRLSSMLSQEWQSVSKLRTALLHSIEPSEDDKGLIFGRFLSEY